MATYYVRKTGNDTTGNGATGTPWLTISKGVSMLAAGDTLIVGNGTYNESVTAVSGSSGGGYKTLQAENRHLAWIDVEEAGDNCITGTGISYFRCDGMRVSNSSSHGVELTSSHHLHFLNCWAHGNSNSGLSFNHCDFVTAEYNICNGNARYGWYSGITCYEAQVQNGDTTTAGPRFIFRGNLCYDNWTVGGSTDGNGILIDDWDWTQNSGTVYLWGALVENNIAYGNGNKGIGVAWSQNCVVRNNTCWANGIDGSQGTWRGDLSNQSGRNNTFVNNIAVANSSGSGSVSSNTAIGNYAQGGQSCTGTIWVNNLTYNLANTGSTSLNIDGTDCATPTVGNGNKLATNPLLVNGPAANFALTSSSPCRDAGTNAYGLSSLDFAGLTRVSGSAVDIGALEFTAGATTTSAVGSASGTGSATATGKATALVAAVAAGTGSAIGDGLSLGGVLHPSTVLSATGYQDSALASPPALVTDLDEANPDSPDSLWWTPVAPGTQADIRLGFATPGALSGPQRFKVRVRPTSGSGTPTVSVSLYESGSLVRELLSDIPVTVEATLSAQWDTSELTDETGAGVEIRIVSEAG